MSEQMPEKPTQHPSIRPFFEGVGSHSTSTPSAGIPIKSHPTEGIITDHGGYDSQIGSMIRRGDAERLAEASAAAIRAGGDNRELGLAAWRAQGDGLDTGIVQGLIREPAPISRVEGQSQAMPAEGIPQLVPDASPEPVVTTPPAYDPEDGITARQHRIISQS